MNSSKQSNEVLSFVTPLAPDSGKLLLNLRNLGYSTVEAIADIVDNALDANATKVEVTVFPSRDNKRVNIRISDDGLGMTADSLLAAMSLVSRNEREFGALGKFGIGLKSAGLYLADSVTVASKQVLTDSPAALRWFFYLEHDAYRLTDELSDEGNRLLEEFTPTNFDLKTFVLLEGLLEKHLEGLEITNAAAKLASDLDRELSLIFGRILRNEKRSLTIVINGQPIEGIDPLQTPDAKRLPTELVRLPNASLPPIRVECAFTTSEETIRPSHGRFERNLPDGLYIYRNDRLMHAGQWFGMKPVRHSSNVNSTRIVISTLMDHDDFFAPSIAKNKVVLPKELKKHIQGLPSKIQRLLAPKKRASDGPSASEPSSYPLSIEDFKSAPVRRILSSIEAQLPEELFEELLLVLSREVGR